MLKPYKYKLNPNNEQKHFFNCTFGCIRFVYNKCLEKAIAEYQATKKTFNCYDLIKYLPSLKEEYPFLKDVDSTCLQQAVINLGKSYKNFFAYLKKPKKAKKKKKNIKNTGFPNFKRKHGSKPSARFAQSLEVTFDNHRMQLPKIGLINFYPNQVFDTTCHIKNITVSRDRVGDYWASVLVVEPDNILIKPDITEDNACGVDMNQDCISVCDSNNVVTKYIYPDKIFNIDKTIKFYQKELSRKVIGSSNFNKTKHKIAQLYLDKTNSRENFMYQVSSKITSNNQTVIVETLDINSIVYQSYYKKSRANTYNAGWRFLFNVLEYKCEQKGLNYRKVDKYFPSSKMCCQCGTINRQVVKGVKMWKCVECGRKHDRDVNAPVNIKYEGLVNASVLCSNVFGHRIYNANPPDHKKFGGKNQRIRNNSGSTVTLSHVKSVDCYPKGRIAYL